MQSVRGWVYVLTNPAMPGLVKIGYSTKDPVFRVEELNSTGLPHSFELVYDALLYEPLEMEQEVHRHLARCHEAKEFFRLTPSDAIAAVRAVAKRIGRTVLCEQLGRPGRREERRPVPGVCGVCYSGVTKADTRCPKCFAMLP